MKIGSRQGRNENDAYWADVTLIYRFRKKRETREAGAGGTSNLHYELDERDFILKIRHPGLYVKEAESREAKTIII